MKIFTLVICLVFTSVISKAQIEFIGVAASHKLVAPSVKSGNSGCPSGTEQINADNEMFEKELVVLINIERDNAGLPPLKLVDELTLSSRYHAKDMADQDYFSHNSISGCTTFDRIASFYSYMSAGENIASGFSSPESVNTGFINSPPHYANMINSNYSEIGIGYYHNPSASGNHRWVENFGSRSGNYPVIINMEEISTDQPDVNIYAYGKDTYDEIRFSNDGVNWSNWMNFDNPEFNWTLAGNQGTNIVYTEMRSGSSTKTSQDDIEYTGPITSIDNIKEFESFEIFPNPATSLLTLYNVEKYTHYKIYTMAGQEMQNGSLSQMKGVPVNISINKLPNTTYIIMLTHQSGALEQKLFVKH